MPRKVWLPSGKGGRVWMSWVPKWSAEGEVPICTVEFAEADVRWFASGTVEVVMLELPIKVRMPVAFLADRPIYGVSIVARRELVMALKKITQGPGSPGSGGPGVADAKSWPTLVEYLTTTVYPDGQARVPSSMVILADANGWKGCLSDKDNGRSLWRTSETLEGLLLSLEEAAASDDPSHWRQSAEAKFKGKKRG